MSPDTPSFLPPAFLPAAGEITLLSLICVVLIVDLFVDDRRRWVTYLATLATLAITAGVVLAVAPDGPVYTFNDTYVLDPLSTVLKVFTLAVVAFVFVYSRGYLQVRGLERGEFYLLGLFATLGILVLISAHNMLTLYLGLELLSLSLYALVAISRDNALSSEAAMKYFVLGAIASGCFLFGTSIVYGTTGALDLGEIGEAAARLDGLDIHVLFGLSFILVAIAFKFGAVPFHMWVPDVYQGAPTPVTLFIGSAAKVASFALLLRVVVEGLGELHASWSGMLVVLSVLSMAIGNIVAIAQTNLKRMLAYSTISHVGFILMGVLAGTERGIEAAMYYTLAYVIMAAAAFGMILLLSRQGFEADELDDLKGLNARSPWFAGIMLVVMFSMTGVPPMLGFYAKLAVLGAAVDAGLAWLAVLGVIFSVIGAFYYLRIVKLMYFDEPGEGVPIVAGTELRVALSLNGALVLALGLFPDGLISLCNQVFG